MSGMGASRDAPGGWLAAAAVSVWRAWPGAHLAADFVRLDIKDIAAMVVDLGSDLIDEADAVTACGGHHQVRL